jgi:hypothetical protein
MKIKKNSLPERTWGHARNILKSHKFNLKGFCRNKTELQKLIFFQG